MPPPGPSTDPYSTQRPPSQHPSTTWGSNPIHSTSAPCFYHPPAHVSVVCNGHHGCVDASAHALHLAEREHAVLCGLADVDAQVAGQSSLNLLGAVQPACVCATGGRSAQPQSSRRRSACVRDTQSSLACVKMASTDTLSRHRSACWMSRMCLTGRSASPSHTWAPPTTTQDTHLHGVVPQIMTWNLPILVLLNML